MKFGHLRKLLEIEPEDFDDLEIRVAWGHGPDQPTTQFTNFEALPVRLDTNAIDHDAKVDGKEARFCVLLFANNPEFVKREFGEEAAKKA